MGLSDVMRERFERSFRLYEDLLAGLPEEALRLKLPGLPSNAIGAQLWCVIGARESYARAVEAGAWNGFACSLDAEGSTRKSAVSDALARSAAAVRGQLARLDQGDDVRAGLIVDLLEHEVAHQGQLIRYLYGLRLPIPASWKSRYALD